MADMSPAELLTAWEDAYLAQCQTARVGRLFKGTIHNLNGVIQAFSMQSELFAMMFTKVDQLLAEALDSVQDEHGREKISQARQLLQKRQRTLGQVEEKILLSQEILKNNDDLSQLPGEGSSVTLHSLVNNIVSFFHSQMFFKHKVEKNVSVEVELALGAKAFALAVIVANLVENSIEAMEHNPEDKACFALRCFQRDDTVIIEVEDNGIGVPEELQESLFQQFVSATPGHQGLGLYQARKLVAELGGTIELSGPRKPTIFTVSLPKNLGEA
jgi:signal transduction histidine kinase